MRKNRLIFTLILTLAAVICASFALSGCKDNPPEEQPAFVNPDLKNITVDLSDRPEGMLVGDALVTSVTLNGGAFDKYVVREGYFLITHEYYGEIGVGEHSLAFTFSNYQSVTVTVKIVSEKAPDYTMPEGKFIEFNEGEAIELPEAVKNRKYQDYEITYAVKNAKDQTVLEAGDGKAVLTPDIAEGLAAGRYTYTVKVSQGQNVIEERAYTVVVGVGENIFAKKYQASWSVQATSNIKVDFDTEENALTVTPLTEDDRAAALTSHNRRIYLSTLLRDAYEAGYETLTFEYKTDFEGMQNYGFRIYANSTDMPTNANMVKEVLTVSNTNGKLVVGEWTEVSINVKSVFEQAEIDGVSIVVLGNTEGSIAFRHSYFGKASADVFSEDYMWQSVNTDAILTAFDDTEQATKISYLLNNTDNAKGRNFVAYLSIDKIKQMYEAGNKALTFKAKATTDIKISFYAKKTAGRDGGAITDNASLGIAVYGGFDLTAQYQEYTIGLEKFLTGKASTLAYEDIKYIAIVFYGATGEAFFKEATYQTEYQEPSIDYSQVNLFSQANASGWAAQAPSNTGLSFDTTNNAVKVVSKTLDDRNAAFTSNNRRIYTSTEIFKAAYEAGYTKFTFEYNATVTTGATYYGFCVCANPNTANGNMVNAGTGLLKLNGSDLVTGSWKQESIDLAALFAESANVQGISIVVIGNVDTAIMFRNGVFSKAQ